MFRAKTFRSLWNVFPYDYRMWYYQTKIYNLIYENDEQFSVLKKILIILIKNKLHHGLILPQTLEKDDNTLLHLKQKYDLQFVHMRCATP